MNQNNSKPVEELQSAIESLEQTLQKHLAKHGELLRHIEERDAALMALIDSIGNSVKVGVKALNGAKPPGWLVDISACLLVQNMPYPTPERLKRIESAKERLKVQMKACKESIN